MRPRITMAIVSSSEGAIVYRESKEQLEINKRRAQFEKNRSKLRCVIVGCQPISSSLICFNNGLASAILQFKQSRR